MLRGGKLGSNGVVRSCTSKARDEGVNCAGGSTNEVWKNENPNLYSMGERKDEDG